MIKYFEDEIKSVEFNSGNYKIMIKRLNKKQKMIKKLTNIIIQSSIQYINEQIKSKDLRRILLIKKIKEKAIDVRCKVQNVK